MPIEYKPGVGTVITGDSIYLYRMLALQTALRLECKGLRRSRGRSAYAIIKEEYGLKGSKQKVLTQFEAIIKQVYPEPD